MLPCLVIKQGSLCSLIRQVRVHIKESVLPYLFTLGCGFKDRETAIRTLWLASQPGSRHKRYWTIRAMRERARFHPHFKNSPKMQEAVVVFDDWLEYWNKKVSTYLF